MSEENLESSVDEAMDALSEGGFFEDDEEENEFQPDENGEADLSDDAGASLDEELTEEEKSSEEEGDEEAAPLEPPTSWRSDEKELFSSLPREMQETALRIQQAQDSHFTQRSTELATKIRETDDERHKYQADRARYASEIKKLGVLASQLFPAKFADVQSEADYLRLKATDPARASEYEAFKQILSGSMRQAAQLRQSQRKERLNKEWEAFVSKYPEFTDGAKAQEMLGGVRKGAVDYYGFTPQEMSVIPDHRYIQVIRDALAWQQHQGNLRAARMKKTVPVQKKILKSSASTNASMKSDSNSALLKRAQNATSDHQKADLLAQMILQG